MAYAFFVVRCSASMTCSVSHAHKKCTLPKDPLPSTLRNVKSLSPPDPPAAAEGAGLLDALEPKRPGPDVGAGTVTEGAAETGRDAGGAGSGPRSGLAAGTTMDVGREGEAESACGKKRKSKG